MKSKSLIGFVVVIFVGSIFLFVNGCRKPEKAAVMTSAGKNSFKEVTSHLDAGGELYIYLSTEKWLHNLSETIGSYRTLLANSKTTSSDQQNINRAFDLMVNLIKNSGVEEVSGVGMSSIEREKDFHLSKTMVHHYPGQDKGYLWSLFGKAPHDLSALDFLPASTACATFSDFEMPLFWSSIQKEVAQSGIPEAQEWVNKVPAIFEAGTGLNWDKFLESFGGEIGFVLTLDESKKIQIPSAAGENMQIPEPQIMFVLKVKSDMLYERLEPFFAQNPQATQVNEGGLKMRSMAIALPIPIPVRASIARSGDYMFLSSSDALIQDALAVKAHKKEGLKSSAEFKRLSVDMPTKGNQFFFLDEKLGKLIKDIQMQSLKNLSKDPSQTALLQNLMKQNNFGFWVHANTAEGWLMSGNSSFNQGTLVAAQGAFVPSLLAAIAVPSFIRARERSQATGVLNEARVVAAMIDQWSRENNKKGDEKVIWSDIAPYLKAGSKLSMNKGNDMLGNPFIFSTASEGVKVNPLTKDALRNATGGDAFWGPYS